MKAKHPPEIGFGLAVTLEAAQDGPTQDEKLRLVGGPPEAVGQNLDGVRRLLQPIEQTGELKAALHMIGFQLEQLAIGANGVPRHRSARELGGLLQSPLTHAPVPRRNGSRVGLQHAGRLVGWVGADRWH